jgi:hypothetical protein
MSIYNKKYSNNEHVKDTTNLVEDINNVAYLSNEKLILNIRPH